MSNELAKDLKHHATEELLAGLVDYDWPVYGLDRLNDVPLDLPYSATLYAIAGRKESGIVGVVGPGTFVDVLAPLPAPTEGQHWDDACACFLSHIVVWNGVGQGGVQTAADGTLTRVYDGTLMGPWPLNPPRAGKIVNPEKARLKEEK